MHAVLKRNGSDSTSSWIDAGLLQAGGNLNRSDTEFSPSRLWKRDIASSMSTVRLALPTHALVEDLESQGWDWSGELDYLSAASIYPVKSRSETLVTERLFHLSRWNGDLEYIWLPDENSFLAGTATAAHGIGNAANDDFARQAVTIPTAEDYGGELDSIWDRLTELRQEAAIDDIELSESSFADLIAFISGLADIRRPALALLDSGTFRAVWKNDAKEQVAIHFKGEGNANYVLFHLSDGKMQRDYGYGSIAHVEQLVTANHLWRLIVNEG
jgi:hypothetical protein